MAMPTFQPQAPDTQCVRLVVVENGAHSIDSSLISEGCQKAVVIQQSNAEAPLELVGRIIEQIAALGRAGKTVEQAVIFAAPRLDGQSMAARHLLARALLKSAHIALTRSAELIFNVNAGASGELRHAFMGLVEALFGDSSGLPVPIRLRFGPPETLRVWTAASVATHAR